MLPAALSRQGPAVHPSLSRAQAQDNAFGGNRGQKWWDCTTAVWRAFPEELCRLSNGALGAGTATSMLGITVLLETDLLIPCMRSNSEAFNSKPKVKTRLAACLDLSHASARGQFSSPRSFKSKCSNSTFYFEPEALSSFCQCIYIYKRRICEQS